jgi:Raf kinase inhibitor-like YbhB/YbcL family protein
MKMLRAFAGTALVLGVSIGMLAQGPPGGGAPGGGGGKGGGGGRGGGGRGGGGLAAPMVISVAGYTDGGMIPDSIGCGANMMQKDSPKIDWTGAPAGTMAFALILHDADMVMAGNLPDILHWAIYDIPGTATGLPAGVPKMATLADGSMQLNSIGRAPGFYSPCPPAPTTHHYIIELYALDAKLGLPATTSRADLMAAILMHTRGKGTYYGVYHV